MNKKYLQLLLRLMSNYVRYLDNVEDAKRFLNTVANYTTVTLTKEDKEEMYWDTVHALNAGLDEAEENAFFIRLKALCSGDNDLIEQIENLHEVI